MNIFALLIIAMAIIILMLRRHIPIGPCMLTGGLFIWLMKTPELHYLTQAFTETLSLPRTYDIIFALYFVMCLEIELRTSGALAGMVHALQRIFSSNRVTLAVMPAFLGLLPSLGGARFSAPIVEEASKGLGLTSDHQSAINFWFRHIFEFSSPIIPGMIMACNIAGVAYSEFIMHLCWLTVLMFSVGWFVLIRPIKADSIKENAVSQAADEQGWQDLWLSLSPVVLTFVLVVFFNMNASVGMGVVTAGLFIVLHFTKREVSLKEVVVGAIDMKMFFNVLCILYFIQILTVTQVLQEIVTAFQSSPLPVPVIIACVSFIIGVLTGMSQGHVAIIMPIIAAMQTGSLNLAGVAMAFGVAGQMLTPTHMCLVVTVDYFKANFFKTLKPVLIGEVMLLTIFSVYTYFTW
ncbi:DUF401 family protein [uncultured Phascolarctobacterium sp.]|jgi:integral membrane protein (TIGR00529 family)|uniref:DUF401 family protein n=1 Tax=uncultured Phascolarctobacterium sp. TaxID=512296 RepID=UPI0025F8AD22|nr:DUF401 family protein [uncultured Phascolarctobacterium sp.]